jgi:membrane protease YdiL (CAAX protease family)
MSTLPENDPLAPESPQMEMGAPEAALSLSKGLDLETRDSTDQGPVSGHDFNLAAHAPQIEMGARGLDSETRVSLPWETPVVPRHPRIPHFGHVLLLLVLAIIGWMGAGLVGFLAIKLHLYGVKTLQQATTDIHYTLGTMALLYLFTFLLAWMILPLFWNRSFPAGLQWNGEAWFRYRGRLFAAACICFVLAMVDQVVLPGPSNAPIDELFKTRTAAWLLFAFGVTVAPLSEEIIFRGFLLPAFSTAYDWATEKIKGQPAPPLGPLDAPRWSLPAMVVGSILTSIPFAAMHAEQTAYSIGPFVLLVCVSMVLCLVRLGTRSLACSIFVHASYNFLLFSLMLIGTGGFKHLDKM